MIFISLIAPFTSVVGICDPKIFSITTFIQNNLTHPPNVFVHKNMLRLRYNNKIDELLFKMAMSNFPKVPRGVN